MSLSFRQALTTSRRVKAICEAFLTDNVSRDNDVVPQIRRHDFDVRQQFLELAPNRPPFPGLRSHGLQFVSLPPNGRQ